MKFPLLYCLERRLAVLPCFEIGFEGGPAETIYGSSTLRSKIIDWLESLNVGEGGQVLWYSSTGQCSRIEYVVVRVLARERASSFITVLLSNRN